MKRSITTGQQDKAHLTLGVLISIFGGYQDTIWNGIVQAAQKDNANVICFVGASLNVKLSFRKYWNTIYDLASPASLDGLIVLSSVFSAQQNDVTVEEISRFFARYAPLPTISIAQELRGIPSVTVDNSAGLRALLRHLIEQHGYRRIAFIRGPENNLEAEARYRVYTEALEDYDIPFNPALVTTGNFYVDSGVESVKLLAQRGVSFDVVVASNDYMAIGACQELLARGLNIPADVAVTGFDDIPDAEFFSIPLTTVRQSLIEQGQQATRMLLEYLRSGSPPESLILDTEPVIRESCGCLPLAASGLASSTPVTFAGASGVTLVEARDGIVAEIQEVICPNFSSVTPQSIEPLVDAFFDAFQGKPSARFLQLLSHLLRKGANGLSYADLQREIMSRWQEALMILHEKAMPFKPSDVVVDMEKVLYQGSILITETAEHVHLSQQGHAETNMMLQTGVVRDVNLASDPQQIADVLARDLPMLGIGTCALVLYEGEPIPQPLSRLIMACYQGDKIALKSDGQIFPSNQLIPPDKLPRDKWPLLAIHPLMARDMHFGFLAMEMFAGRRAMYNTYIALPEQIGSALYRALLRQQNEQANRQLEQHAARLAQANVQLAEANTQLEQFVDIASHDLQEPLRMVASYLQLLERRYHDKLDDDAAEFIDYAVSGAVRMKLMLKDLLFYSRMVTESRPFKPTDCDQLLAQTLSNLEIVIKENDVLVTHDPLPTVMADGSQLATVFQNLIDNAIKFHSNKQPHIHIAAEQAEHEWLFSVRDNGIGISQEYFERIFIVFRRLHTQVEYPGTGIGLAICKKVIERHGGHIWVESRPGEGSTFFFTIPLLQRGHNQMVTDIA